jgi:branched-chain amino acid transport system substrate-binding protein
MTSSITRFLAAWLLAGVALAHAQPQPVVVGVTVAQSGALADLAADYLKGLQLWQEDVNARGGLLGRRLELKVRDDASDASQVAELYRRLMREDKADLLIGPFGSAASLVAGAEAETARRVLVNGAGASSAVHRRSPRYVFQTLPPYSAYAAGVLELAREAGYRKLMILARDEPATREMAEAAREHASRLGLQAGDLVFYDGARADFSPQVARARETQIDAWIAFGEARDAAEMVKNFKRLDYAPSLFFARRSFDAGFVSQVGQDAEFALGVVEYDPRLPTPANAAFTRAFSAKFSSPPGPAAAEAWSAGMVLAEAVRRAGSVEQQAVRAALAALDTGTLLGGYRVDPVNGIQLAARPVLVQIQQGVAQIVWPAALATARRVLPYPQWHERKIMK